MGHRQQGYSDDLTEHHVIPRSRGGADDETNILYKPILAHQAWHHMIVNATPDEVIQLFEALRRIENGRRNSEALLHSEVYRIVFRTMPLDRAVEMIHKRWRKPGGAWEIVFGRLDVSYREAIEIIRRDWMMP
ncbi:MAG: hypothetical protein Q7R79_03310 [bacterium]|nr:hypothetical protein [bacterium]